MIGLYVLSTVVFVIVGYTDLSVYIQLYKYYRFFFGRLPMQFFNKMPKEPSYPHVLIQIPAYRPDTLSKQDREIAETQLLRTVENITRLWWPKERLWIQILDESTNPIRVFPWAFQGFKIETISRKEHSGKADNLNHGLSTSFGVKPDYEYVAVLDSDFRPDPTWLKRSIGYLEYCNEPEREEGKLMMGCVQSRWVFTNQNTNVLTISSSLLLHSHFCVDKIISERDRGTSYFNGSGGVWLRECITDCGGWPSVPFAQDLAMSNIAIKLGWRIGYNPLLVCPNELASTWMDFLDQQKRWACGGTMQGNKFWFANYYCRLLLCILCIVSMFITEPHNLGPMVIYYLFGMPYIITLPYFYCVGRISGMPKRQAFGAAMGLPFVGLCSMLWCSWGVVNAWLPTKKRPSVTRKTTI